MGEPDQEYRIAYSGLHEWARIEELEGLGWEPFATAPSLIVWRKRQHVSSGERNWNESGEPR